MKYKFNLVAVAALILLIPILLVGCRDDDTDSSLGLSRAEVEEIVRTELADMPQPTPPAAGLSLRRGRDSAGGTGG